MKMYKVRSDYTCLVKHLEGECILDQNSCLSFEKPETLLIYPLCERNKAFLPFVLNLNENSSSSFFQHYSLKEYGLFFLTYTNYVENEIVEKIDTLSNSCKLVLSEEYISFETEGIRKTISVKNKFNNYSIKTIKDLVLVSLQSDVDELWIFDTKNTNLRHFEGKKIELLENQIVITREINDIAKHIVFESFEIENDQIVQKSFSSKLVSQEQNLVKNPKIIPIAFLESIKYRDFDLAKKYLSETLKQSSNDALSNFFGDISKIIPLENSVVGIISNGMFKSFLFNIENGLITEIAPYV